MLRLRFIAYALLFLFSGSLLPRPASLLYEIRDASCFSLYPPISLLHNELNYHTHGRVGVSLDTGWFGTQGYNAAQAILELQGHLLSIHIKDVLAPGGHDTCRYGQGCVPIEACVKALKQIGYDGVISIEHEPALFDPGEDIRANLKLLKTWLAA